MCARVCKLCETVCSVPVDPCTSGHGLPASTTAPDPHSFPLHGILQGTDIISNCNTVYSVSYTKFVKIRKMRNILNLHQSFLAIKKFHIESYTGYTFCEFNQF